MWLACGCLQTGSHPKYEPFSTTVICNDVLISIDYTSCWTFAVCTARVHEIVYIPC